MGFLNRKGRPFRDERVVLSKIYNWFLKPMLKDVPLQVDETGYLEAQWGVKLRVVERFRANKPFEMPGLFLEAPNAKMYGRGERQIPEGQEIWVRLDPVLGRVHVCFEPRPEGDDITYELTPREWTSVQRFITEVEDPCEHSPST
jgi:hypothetical protein